MMSSKNNYALPGGPGGVFPIRTSFVKRIPPPNIGHPILKKNQQRPHHGDKCSCGGTLEIEEPICCYSGLYYFTCKCGYKSRFYKMKLKI